MRYNTIVFLFAMLLMCPLSVLAQADLFPAKPSSSTDSGSRFSRLDLVSCLCPQHAGQTQAAPRGLFGQAGIMMLDSLPNNAAVLAMLSLESEASADSSENVGYKKFYATMQLKAQAALHGANALIGFRQTIDTTTNKIIFSATAARVER